jgi:imidazolonepropionase-like amidohydrolase
VVLGAVFAPVGTVEEATRFVAARRVAGADYLKILLAGVRSATQGTPNLDQPRVSALVEAAHAFNMLAIAHVESLDDANVALSAGVDGLAHVWRRGGPSPEVARRLAARGVFVTATLDIPDGRLPERRAALLADPRFQSILTDPIRAHVSRSVASTTIGADGLRANIDAQMAAVRGLHQAGVSLLVGTDASSSNTADHGISVHHEIELFRKAGLSPSEILAAATASTADAFRLSDRGRIQPGRRADLLLVRGDPTEDVLAIRDILRVWKSGVEVDRMAAGR